MKPPTWMLALALLGCGDKDDDSGTDATDGATDGTADGADGTADGADGTADGVDGTADGADGTSPEEVTVAGVAVSDCGDGGSPRLTASLAGATSISVVHEAFEANCCADLSIDVDVSGSTLAMLYTDQGEPCDCTCSFDVSYQLQLVPSGTWTVTAGGGVSDTVTVP